MTTATSTETVAAKPATLGAVQKYFSNVDPAIAEKPYNMAQFRADWAQLSDQSKTDLRTGLGDESMTY